jgi:hypothetical protein
MHNFIALMSQETLFFQLLYPCPISSGFIPGLYNHTAKHRSFMSTWVKRKQSLTSACILPCAYYPLTLLLCLEDPMQKEINPHCHMHVV